VSGKVTALDMVTQWLYDRVVATAGLTGCQGANSDSALVLYWGLDQLAFVFREEGES
jgi:hypothetical protein